MRAFERSETRHAPRALDEATKSTPDAVSSAGGDLTFSPRASNKATKGTPDALSSAGGDLTFSPRGSKQGHERHT